MKHTLIILILPFLNGCETVKILTGPPLDNRTSLYSWSDNSGTQRYLWDLRHGVAKPIGSYHIPNVYNREDLYLNYIRSKARPVTRSHRVGSNGYTYTYTTRQWSKMNLDEDRLDLYWDKKLGKHRRKMSWER